MQLGQLDSVLAWAAAAHVVVAIIAALALVLDAPLVLGVHPAWKPLKFGLSIALFLGALAILLPMLSVGPWLRAGLAWTLTATMIAEVVPIIVQALRGRASHFNTHTSSDAVMWRVMFVAIVIASVAMAVIAVVATMWPLRAAPLVATAWRAGLWMFALAVVTGAAMGGRSQHSVGGSDGGSGLPIVNWSRDHGDLRVAHFISLHALQSLPIIAALLLWLPLPALARWLVLGLAIALHVGLTLWTLRQALAGRALY